MWQIKIGRDILTMEVPSEEQAAMIPSQATQPRDPVPEREVPITSGCKNQQRLWLRETEGFWRLTQTHSL